MLARWLLRVLRQGPVKPDQTGRSGVTFLRDADKGHIFRAMEDACCSLLRFFQIIHKSGLWLDRNLAQSAADAVQLFCQSYTFLAREFHKLGKFLFHLEPALHMYRHVGLRITTILRTGAPAVLSPAAHLTDQSEDFVGVCSRISRRVAARTCGQRTVQRMLIRYHLEFEKLGV